MSEANYDAESLYQLIPAVYRRLDAERGGPLRDLVEILAGQAEIVARDVQRLHDNSFIETCDEWTVPYIGDLLGVRGLRPGRKISARAEVANTLGYRRRKGTAAMLEQLARDVTGWPARVVEFFQLLATSQFMNHVRLDAPAAAHVRDAGRMELVESPFDTSMHTADVRRIEPRQGWHNIPHVGLFVWRLLALPQLLTQPHAVDAGEGHFTFHPLGVDSRLFTHLVSETGPASIAEEIHVPAPIRLRALADDLNRLDLAAADPATVVRAYVGPGLSLAVYRREADEWRPFDALYLACDLEEWDRALPIDAGPFADGIVAIDPELGRLRFENPADQLDGLDPETDLRVSSYHGFSDQLGGGQYDRAATQGDVSEVAAAQSFRVGAPNDPLLAGEPPGSIEPAISPLLADSPAHPWPAGTTRLVEIVDSRTYVEDLAIDVPEGGRLILRAADGQRPTVVLSQDLEIAGGSDSNVEIDGLWIAGGALVLTETGPADEPQAVNDLTLRHTTLVPRQDSAEGEDPRALVSLWLESNRTEVTIERSILGPVRSAPEVVAEISDSILDSFDADAWLAWGALTADEEDDENFGGSVTIRRSTLVGGLRAAAVTLGENSLFLGPAIAERRQVGCVRYSWVAPGSRVPRRYRCQPQVPDGTPAAEAERLVARLRPRFTRLVYGDPAYCQLDWRGPREILRGAEDGSEMGVFSSLQQPLREDDLRLRLDEYLPVGLEAGILFAT